MFTPRRLYASSFLLLCFLSTGLAQGDQPGSVRQKASQTSSTVTASAAAERVRFTAPSNVVRMQLQVISENGEILFDVSSKGNVLDWTLQDSSGQRLQGAYLTVVTVKTLSGRLSEKIGSVSVADKQVELQRVEATQLTAAQQQAVGPIEENATLTILNADEAEATTALANNGSDGQIIRDRGALSFRLGNFYSGTDLEQMRLTEEGNLGIGTDNPQAKLDVAGVIRTSKGIEFSNGADPANVTKLTTTAAGNLQQILADGTVVPNATGTGTQNKLAKWTDSAGTLGDSIVTESNGGIGIGTSSPQAALHVIGNQFLKPVGATPTYKVLAGSDPSSTVMLTTDSSAFGWQIAPSNAASDTIVQVLGQSFASVPNRGEFGIYLGTDGNSAFKVIQRGGPELMRVARTGDVGIGNTAPGAKLDVTGAINSAQYNISSTRILSAAGASNIFAGFQAGNISTPGDNNSFFGVFAGFSNSGTSNSFVGSRAGALNTGGGRNSFFGADAGDTNVSGVRNIAIGYASDVGSAGLTNATAIGSQARVDQSNSLILGSIQDINGAFENTKIGIGVTAPLATLHVVSFSNSATDNTADFEAPTIGSNHSHIHFGTSGDWYIRSAASEGKVVLQDTGGNVGIGTGSPNAKLQVSGGDVAITTVGTGIILRSTTGVAGVFPCYRLTVDFFGDLSTTLVTCPSL